MSTTGIVLVARETPGIDLLDDDGIVHVRSQIADSDFARL